MIEFSVNTNPNTIFTGTTWDRFAGGKVTVGFLSGDADFGTIGQTGGEKKHQLTVGELPKFKVKLPISDSSNDPATYAVYGEATGEPAATVEDFSSFSTSTRRHLSSETGNNEPHNNLPPYVVTAKWVRTA